MTFKVVICDDDKESIQSTVRLLEQYGMQNDIDFSIKQYTSAESLLNNYLTPGMFHIAFFDVEMPNINGLQLAKDIKHNTDKDLQIIFLSNYPKYMQDCFPIHPVNYLTKPLTIESLSKVMTQLIQELTDATDKKLMIQCTDCTEIISIDDIMYINKIPGKKNTITFYLKDRTIDSHGVIRDIEKELKDIHFFSPYRGILINLNCVHYFNDNSVVLLDGTKLPVSRRKLPEFHKLITRHAISLNNN